MADKNREVMLDKISYMMDRMAGNDELSVDDLESMIHKVFVASFEFTHGFEASLIHALLDARHALIEAESETDENDYLSGEDAEKWYLQCQVDMYKQAGCDEGYAQESASWPDSLPLNAEWQRQILKDLARKEVAHHLVVMEQIRAEMEKKNVNADS